MQEKVSAQKPVATKPNKEHFIQVAAVTSSKQANQLIKSLKRKNVKRILIVKSARQTGGSWFKIRVGPFGKKGNALKLAKQMMDDNLIKNYFLVSKPKFKVSETQG